MLRALFKLTVTIFAVLLIVAGIIITPSPLPFGVIFVVLGFLLLTAVAPDFVRWMRRKWRWLDRQILRLEKRLPRWIAKQLKKSGVEDDGADRDERGSRV